MIQKYAEECIKKMADANMKKQTAKSEKEDSYMDKLTMKIIDNLQVSIKSIHIRYEETMFKSYSWGLSLDRIDVYTTDKDGTRKFIDRTQKEFMHEPMRKTLILSNLGVYWNSDEKFMFFQMESK